MRFEFANAIIEFQAHRNLKMVGVISKAIYLEPGDIFSANRLKLKHNQQQRFDLVGRMYHDLGYLLEFYHLVFYTYLICINQIHFSQNAEVRFHRFSFF